MSENVRRDCRLDRRLAELGVGTRSEVGKLIRRKHVTVNGEIVRAPETHVALDAELRVDGELVEGVPRLLAYHKPEGVLVTLDDPWGRATIATALGERLSGRMHPVGRLDADTAGLLLLSSDGAATQRLLHPRHAVEKEYVATVEGVLDATALAERLTAGVETAEGVHTARLLEALGDRVRLVVTEGKHRMVRRMLANVGHPVLTLRRERIGPVSLGDLPVGETRPLSDAEAFALAALGV